MKGSPVLRVFLSTHVKVTHVSPCLTSHVLTQTLILAQTLTSDPYKPEPLKTRQSVVLKYREISQLKM